MISAFVFDIGNVLLRFDFNTALKRIEQYCTGPIVVNAIEPLKIAYEEGRVSSDDFKQRLIAILNYTGTPEVLVSAWEEIFSENTVMTDLVRRLYQNYPLYLLSNTSDLHLEFIRRNYPVFEFFRDGVYSYRVGLSKPDPAIFETAARQFGIQPSETLYIDDLEPNVHAARNCGFHAFHYDEAKHTDFEAELDRLGVRR